MSRRPFQPCGRANGHSRVQRYSRPANKVTGEHPGCRVSVHRGSYRRLATAPDKAVFQSGNSSGIDQEDSGWLCGSASLTIRSFDPAWRAMRTPAVADLPEVQPVVSATPAAGTCGAGSASRLQNFMRRPPQRPDAHATRERLLLCRCGVSADLPYCDERVRCLLPPASAAAFPYTWLLVEGVVTGKAVGSGQPG